MMTAPSSSPAIRMLTLSQSLFPERGVATKFLHQEDTMLISRRGCLTGMAAVGLAPVAAIARQPYPLGLNIKVIVLAAAGGSIDLVGRIVADRLAAMWGVPVVVENRSEERRVG